MTILANTLSVGEDLGAPNATTTPINITGVYNVSVSGTFVGTLYAEISSDDGATWSRQTRDVFGVSAGFTAPGCAQFPAYTRRCLVRVRFVARTSGTAVVRVSQ